MHTNRGFTLLEVAVVVLVITLLLGTLLVPLATQVDQRKVSDTQKSMDEIREALMGFAMTNGRLPCPDTDGDGLENPRLPADAAAAGCAGGAQPSYVGSVPWATLGVARADAWGDRFKYRVTNEFTRATGDITAPVASCPGASGNPNACTLELSDVGNLQVKGRDSSTKAEVALTVDAPAVVISFGKNGYGATHENGEAQPAVPVANVDETANSVSATTVFYSRPNSAYSSTCSDTANPTQPLCEFDDLVIWVPTGILFNRMVAAGKLP